MKIVAITRVRNESEIMLETLNHLELFCDYAYVYDDKSTDNTVEICKNHKLVKEVIEGDSWDENRERAEFQNRQMLIDLVIKDDNIGPDDWVLYVDADERIEFNDTPKDKSVGAIKLRLFDFYITEEDKDKHYSDRKFMGPEYRDILFMYRKKHILGYHIPDQRECSLKGSPKIVNGGFVKHYGKSISIQQWEDTCEYYSKNFPKYSKKWELRKGKAIHTVSDFGRPLITWEEKENKNKIVKIG
jgi:glycosyltransferase involved in cell wall biosynthesis